MATKLINQIVQLTNLPEDKENQQIAEVGVRSLLKELFKEKDPSNIRVDKKYVEGLIEELDNRLSAQLDEIIHHNEFQALEAPWRSLKFLVNRTDFNENIKIEVLSVNKEDLLEDFQDAAEVTETGLYRKMFTDEFGQFGGEPFGVIVGNYELTPAKEDVTLLGYMSQVSAMNHAPFIAAADQSFFGLSDFDELPQIKQVEAVFEGPQFSDWRNLRETDDSRNIGLAMPRFMLRSTYGQNVPVKSFNYRETVTDKSQYLWGNAAFAYATRLTESFAQYRWCPNIIGPQSGGAVNDLAIDIVNVNGTDHLIGPVEVAISDRKEYELSEMGFMPLTLRKDSDSAVFFSSSSVQKPKKFAKDDEGRQAELNYKLGTQLPYLFIVNRLAHYIKVLQRENLGSWKSKTDLESELNKWIRQYVADQENPSAATRSQRPLRKATLAVSNIESDAGWYEVNLEVTPHFKFMGANFTLSLTSMLERA